MKKVKLIYVDISELGAATRESGKAGYRARARGLGPNNGFSCSMLTTGGDLGVQRLSPEFGDDEIFFSG